MAEKTKFYYDVVFCLDKTVKNDTQFSFISSFIENFPNALRSYVANAETRVERVRIKVIEYSDYNVCENAVIEHEFLELPEDFDKLADIFDAIEFNTEEKYEGHSSGLEALSYAFRSEWGDFKNKKGRQAVALFSLNQPLSLEESRNLDAYPKGIPANLFELKKLWETQSGMTQDKRLLAIFSPKRKDKNSWTSLESWDDAIAIGSEDINDFDSAFVTETLLIDLI